MDDDDAEVPAGRVGPPPNAFAAPAVALGLVAVLIGSFARLGAWLGVVAIVFGVCGVVRAEKTDSGLPASLSAVVIGLIAVGWAATSLATR